MAVSTDPYVYFLYSEQQEKWRSEVEAKMGRVFEPGTVVVTGRRVPFTELSSKPTNRLPDVKIIAEGYRSKMKYADIKTTIKRR